MPDFRSDVDIVAEYVAKRKAEWNKRWRRIKHKDTSAADAVIAKLCSGHGKYRKRKPKWSRDTTDLEGLLESLGYEMEQIPR